jgi:hypothetical protein
VRYLMFIKHKELAHAQTPPKALMEAMGPFVERMFASGALKETGGLQPLRESVRIRSHNGELHVVDGPYTETKEVVGGYAIVETKTKDEALAVATEFMELHRLHWPEFECESEVRLIEGI